MAKKVLPIHPDPLADVHRTCNLLLPLASARCDMVFQTSNNNSNNKKEKSRKGNTGRIYFSPLDVQRGRAASTCLPNTFRPRNSFQPTSTHCARGMHESMSQTPIFSTTHERRPLFPPRSSFFSSPPFHAPKQTNKTNFFIFFSSSSHCHFLFPTAQTNHRHSRFLAKGPQKRRQIRQNRQTKDMHQIQDPMQQISVHIDR